jgi:hypothetical protein
VCNFYLSFIVSSKFDEQEPKDIVGSDTHPSSKKSKKKKKRNAKNNRFKVTNKNHLNKRIGKKNEEMMLTIVTGCVYVFFL